MSTDIAIANKNVKSTKMSCAIGMHVLTTPYVVLPACLGWGLQKKKKQAARVVAGTRRNEPIINLLHWPSIEELINERDWRKIFCALRNGDTPKSLECM